MQTFTARFECSTPSGITASGTRASPSGTSPPRVLNAFQHHGERDAQDFQANRATLPCSTPS
ncbi:hypothetical protein ACLESD_26050, partial [Pyxidicoccus sp. 3LFB2]